MPVSRKTFVSIAALAAAILPLAAQAGEVIWWTPNWSQARAQEVAKKFEAANPGIKIKLEITVSDGLQNRVLVALRSGNTPDVIDVQHGWIIPFAATGSVLPLDEFYAASKLNQADFHQAAMNLTKLDGKSYGLPYRVEAHAVYYNKGAYREAGLDPNNPPKTWAQLIDASKKLTKMVGGKQQYGYGITGGGEFGNTVFRSIPLIWMNGGDILSADLKKSTLNEKGAVEAVEFYTGMLTKEKVAPPSTLQNDGTALRRLFIAGSVAQYQSGQFDIASIKKEAPGLEIGVMPIPSPDGKKTSALLGGWSFIVPAATKNKAETLKFMAYLADLETMGYYTDTFPARPAAMSQARFQDPDLAAFKDMLPFARPAPAHKNWVQITQVYFNHVQRVLLGDATAQKAMDDAAKEIGPLLD